MTIDITLSDASINRAIRKIEEAIENLQYGANDFVEVLAHNGAEVAQSAYGKMATAQMQPVSMTEAEIVVSGGDKAIIAEFGAGYATMEYHPFAQNAPVPIKVASYSEAHDGMFALTDHINPGEGYWILGWAKGGKGKVGHAVYMDRVQPRHGLLNAYDYIMQNSDKVAEEVFKL